ncbi:MAG TPA: UDP-glucose 4-epimerase GalE [Xanthomonadaceae bacterium]|jgi:UDP-glucose 4-epimerase
MSVLVCGGAGYIGSHMVRRLKAAGLDPVVLDNLSTGHRQAIDGCELVVGDLLDTILLEQLFAEHKFESVMHFCAKSLVGESMHEPYAYYHNNVSGTLNLLAAMRSHGSKRLIFSSTAAVYGMPQGETIDEDHPCNPINPYGHSKLMVEQILRDAARAYGLRSATLRYFNAAGASADAWIGEAHEPETHLIPNALRATDPGAAPLSVFGNDYPTRDGTCVRDYVHVDDLADAHLLALEYLGDHEGAHVFNLGNGDGFSVLEVLNAAHEVTGREIPWQFAPRRAGDPTTLVASSARARGVLGWQPERTQIGDIIASAWRWHCKRRF